MKNLDYKFVHSQSELKEMIESGYTMGLSISNDNRGKYVVCNEDYKEVFKEITDKKYDEFGIAFPLNDIDFIENSF